MSQLSSVGVQNDALPDQTRRLLIRIHKLQEQNASVQKELEKAKEAARLARNSLWEERKKQERTQNAIKAQLDAQRDRTNELVDKFQAMLRENGA